MTGSAVQLVLEKDREAKDNAVQLTDDRELLNAFVIDQNAAPAAYLPILFWESHQQKVIERLEREGLTDIRQQTNGEFVGFVPNENRYMRDAARAVRSIGNLSEHHKQSLFNATVAACLNPELGLLPFGLSVSDIEQLSFKMSDFVARANGAIPPAQGWDSCAGNPSTYFSVGDKVYTYEWLRYYFIYACFAKFVDFSQIDNIVEVGPGLGMQADVVRKLYPHIRYYLLDNAAQAYVCHQYIRAIFGESLLDYRTLRNQSTITIEQPGQIAVLGNWQIAQLRPLGTTLFWSCGTLCSMEKACFAAYHEFMHDVPHALCLVEHVDGMRSTTADTRHGLLDSSEIITSLNDDFECLSRRPLETPLNRKSDSVGGAEMACLVRRRVPTPFLRSPMREVDQ